jgi:sigma-E factor negative regulatory protein RseC
MAMGEETVTHPGVVKKIEGNKAEISVISKASCISCSLKNVCSVSDMKEKIIEVDIADLGRYHEGESVVVEMKQSYGTWAVLLGYFFPFLVLFFGLMLFLHLGLDQGLAGILAIALLIPYYGVLYLLRHYFKKHFRYQVR